MIIAAVDRHLASIGLLSKIVTASVDMLIPASDACLLRPPRLFQHPRPRRVTWHRSQISPHRLPPPQPFHDLSPPTPVSTPPPDERYAANTTNPAPVLAFTPAFKSLAIPTPDDVHPLYDDSASQTSRAPHFLGSHAVFVARRSRVPHARHEPCCESTNGAILLLH